MGFWDDISRFAGNATGGFIGESDEERRRKRQREQQQQSRPSAAPSRQPSWSPSNMYVQTPAQTQRGPQQSPQQQRQTVNRLVQPTFGLAVQEEEDEALQQGLDVRAQGTLTDPKAQQAVQAARESLGKNRELKDIGNYYGSDADKLRNELLKEKPNAGLVQGLTQSTLNRAAEIKALQAKASESEQQEAIKKRFNEYKGPTFAEGLTGLIGDIGEGFANTVGAPIKTIGARINEEDNNAKLADMQARFERGEITAGRLQEELDDIAGGVIGNTVEVGQNGLQKMSNLKELGQFAGTAAEAGVNAFVGPGAAIRQAVGQGGRRLVTDVAKRSGIEAGFTGTAQTAADLAQGDGVSAESLAINYGGDFLLTAGGDVIGTAIAKMRTRNVQDVVAETNAELEAAGSPIRVNEKNLIEAQALASNSPQTKHEIALERARQESAERMAEYDKMPEIAKAIKEGRTPELEVTTARQPEPATPQPVELPAKPAIEPVRFTPLNEAPQIADIAPTPASPLQPSVTAPRITIPEPVTATAPQARPIADGPLATRSQDAIKRIDESLAKEYEYSIAERKIENERLIDEMLNNPDIDVNGRYQRSLQVKENKELIAKMEKDVQELRAEAESIPKGPNEAETIAPTKAAPERAVEAKKVEAPTQPKLLLTHRGGNMTAEYRAIVQEWVKGGKKGKLDDIAKSKGYTGFKGDKISGGGVIEFDAPKKAEKTETVKSSGYEKPDPTATRPKDWKLDKEGNTIDPRTGEIKVPADKPTDKMTSLYADTSKKAKSEDTDTNIAMSKPVDKSETNPVKKEKKLTDTTRAELRKAYDREKAIWQKNDATLTEMGFDATDIRQKITAAERKEYKPTKDELKAFRVIQDELDDARVTVEGAGVKFEGSKTYYRPESRAGETPTSAKDYTRESLLDFGNSKKRTNAFETHEIDYTNAPEVNYTFKARNRKLVTEDAIAQAAEADGRAVTLESVKEAAQRTMQLEDAMKAASNKSERAINYNTVDELNAVGKAEGYTQTTNKVKIGVAAQEPLNILERAGVYKKGFEQYANADGYAYNLIRRAHDVGQHPYDMVADDLKKAFPDAEASTLGNITSWAKKRLENSADPATHPGIVSTAYRHAARAELLKLGKTTTFENNKLRKVVNEQMNRILLNDAYQRNFGQKLDNFLSHRINESLRGMNVMSAAFEASDFFNIVSDFGAKNLKKSKVGFGKVDGSYYGMSQRYGKTNQRFLSDDIPEEAAKWDKIWSDPKTNVAQKMYHTARNARDKALLFSYVERWKTELFLRQADEFYRAKGLEGKELVDTVNAHFNKTMLPSTALTINRMLSKAPKTVTQYLSWGINSTKRLGRTISGNNEYGKYADLGRGERIVRGVGTEIIPKVATAMVLGVPIVQVLGGRDWTGVSDGDFSGIDNEDKIALDHVVNTLSVSPGLGMLANYYNAYRIEQEENKDAKAEGAPEVESKWFAEASQKNGWMFVPFRTQAKKIGDVASAQAKGYYENRDGRITNEALSTGEAIQGAIQGKNYTPTFRKYADNPDLAMVLRGEASWMDLPIKNQTVENVRQALGAESKRNYTRPLSATSSWGAKGYNDFAKEAYVAAEKKHGKNSEAARKVLSGWIADGRAYNKLYDDLQRKNPDAFKVWTDSKGSDVLTPEKWTMYKAHPEVYKYEKARKLREKNDLKRTIDPIFEEDDKRAKLIMQQRSMHTGEDMKASAALYLTDWYEDFKNKESKYYDSFEGEADNKGKSERYKSWRKLSDELYGDDSKFKTDYPTVNSMNKLYEDYAADSQEVKDWWKTNADTYYAEKDKYNQARLDIVNKMRKLEGTEPMSLKEFTAKIEAAETTEEREERNAKYASKGSGWKNYKKGSRGGRGGRSGGGSDAPERTGIEGSLTTIATDMNGINGPKLEAKPLKDPRKAFKKSRRASRQSKIRIRI